jgi:hypothetical protein
MSQEEFVQWQLFYAMEPRFEERLDINTGWIVLNMQRAMGAKEATLEKSTLNFRQSERKSVRRARENADDVNKANAAFLRMYSKAIDRRNGTTK